jgi:hypothetical protein
MAAHKRSAIYLLLGWPSRSLKTSASAKLLMGSKSNKLLLHTPCNNPNLTLAKDLSRISTSAKHTIRGRLRPDVGDEHKIEKKQSTKLENTGATKLGRYTTSRSLQGACLSQY